MSEHIWNSSDDEKPEEESWIVFYLNHRATIGKAMLDGVHTLNSKGETVEMIPWDVGFDWAYWHVVCDALDLAMVVKRVVGMEG